MTEYKHGFEVLIHDHTDDLYQFTPEEIRHIVGQALENIHRLYKPRLQEEVDFTLEVRRTHELAASAPPTSAPDALWISVEERLPRSNDDCRCLVSLLSAQNMVWVGIRVLDHQRGVFVESINSYPSEKERVTRWQPLPSPPGAASSSVEPPSEKGKS